MCQPPDARAHNAWQRIADFVAREPKAFTSDATIGAHVTASAWIMSPDQQSVLLTHHRKLDRWLQLGGHCDGIEDAAFVARKEAYEESGLRQIHSLSPDVLDVDTHTIPQFGAAPEHLHHDIRFLMQARDWDFRISSESKELAWVPVARLEDYTTAHSVLRLRDYAANMLAVLGSTAQRQT